MKHAGPLLLSPQVPAHRHRARPSTPLGRTASLEQLRTLGTEHGHSMLCAEGEVHFTAIDTPEQDVNLVVRMKSGTRWSLHLGSIEVPPHSLLRAGRPTRGWPRSIRLRSASTTTSRLGGTREYSIPQLPDFALVDASGQGSRARCGCSHT